MVLRESQQPGRPLGAESFTLRPGHLSSHRRPASPARFHPSGYCLRSYISSTLVITLTKDF